MIWFRLSCRPPFLQFLSHHSTPQTFPQASEPASETCSRLFQREEARDVVRVSNPCSDAYRAALSSRNLKHLRHLDPRSGASSKPSATSFSQVSWSYSSSTISIPFFCAKRAHSYFLSSYSSFGLIFELEKNMVGRMSLLSIHSMIAPLHGAQQLCSRTFFT